VTRRSLRLLACLLCTWCWTVFANAAGVVIVASEGSPGFAAAVDAVVGELAREGQTRVEVSQRSPSDLAGMAVPDAAATKLFITLGTDALKQLLARDLRVPVLAALIPRSGFERVMKEAGARAAQSVTVLYLDQPFGRQVDLLRIALPGVKRVGVLWGEESVLLQPALQTALHARGLQEVSGPVVSSGAGRNASLKAALDDTDALLAVADPQVYSSATISNILLATYRARVPMLAFSPAYVKAGALFSLHSTPAQIGTQTGTIARALLQGAVLPVALYPTDFTVGVNEHVAQSLGLTLDALALSDRLRRMEKRP
jgi:putative ABC transport system substrate-binding protein